MSQFWKIDNSEFVRLGIKKSLSNHEGETIELLNLGELQHIKENDPEMILISISGDEVPAKDADEDTRVGYVAFGFLKGYLSLDE